MVRCGFFHFFGSRLKVYRIVPTIEIAFGETERAVGRRDFPATRDRILAFRAVPVAQFILDYTVPRAANHGGVARRTNRIFGAAVNIAFVDEI